MMNPLRSVSPVPFSQTGPLFSTEEELYTLQNEEKGSDLLRECDPALFESIDPYREVSSAANISYGFEKKEPNLFNILLSHSYDDLLPKLLSNSQVEMSDERVLRSLYSDIQRWHPAGSQCALILMKRKGFPFIERHMATPFGETKSTLLMKATSLGWVEELKFSLDKGADPCAQDSSGYTILHEAARYGQSEILSLILEDETRRQKLVNMPSFSSSNELTPLHGAVINGNLKEALLLIEAGADLRSLAKDKKNIFHFAIQGLNHLLLRYLLKNEALRNELLENGDVNGQRAVDLMEDRFLNLDKMVEEVLEYSPFIMSFTKLQSFSGYGYEQSITEFSELEGVEDREKLAGRRFLKQILTNPNLEVNLEEATAEEAKIKASLQRLNQIHEKTRFILASPSASMQNGLRINRTREQESDLRLAYLADPLATSQEMKRELGFDKKVASQIFAMTVFLCDEYLVLKEGEDIRVETQCFLKIAMQLPIELQMLLCNRSQGLGTNLIGSGDREKAFKRVVWRF